MVVRERKDFRPGLAAFSLIPASASAQVETSHAVFGGKPLAKRERSSLGNVKANTGLWEALGQTRAWLVWL